MHNPFMNYTRWTANDIPRMDGRTVVITGGASGIGLSTARGFARAGAHVVLAVRRTQQGDKAAAQIAGNTQVRHLDLADLASIREFASSWQGPVDVLVNNAGVAMVPPGKTRDGFETQFGTNHLGHFALTTLLLPHITDRVVTLASSTHYSGTLRLDDPNLTRGYGPAKAYSQSKLANLLFTLELQRKLERIGSPIRALAAHPGYAASNLGTQGRNQALGAVVRAVAKGLAQTNAKAALPTLYAATQDLPGAGYVGPDGPAGMHGYPALVGRSAEASDPHRAQQLWDLSERLTGVRFDPSSLPGSVRS